MLQWLRSISTLMRTGAIPIGTLTSPLEARGEREGVAIVERTVTQPGVAAVGEALTRFLGDERGMLTVKKALHVVIEDRMRLLAIINDPPDAHGLAPVQFQISDHPIDGLAGQALGLAVAARRDLKPALGAAIHAVALLAKAFGILLGAPSLRTPPRYFSLGAPAFANEAYWQPIHRAIKDSGLDVAGQHAAVIEEGYAVDPGPGVVCIDPAQSAIVRKAWWCEVVVPALRLVICVLWQVWRAPYDAPRAILGAYVLQLVRKSLDFERVLHSTRFGSYVDIIEYTPSHIVKAALLERRGGRLARWPQFFMDNPGAAQSYLGYHDFLGTGPYENANYGHTWSVHCRRTEVGFFKCDRRWIQGAVSPAIAATIEAQREAGRRIFAYFGPSGLNMLQPVVTESLAAVVHELLRCPDWFLVVKAKGYEGRHLIEMAFAQLDEVARLKAEGRLLVVPYEKSGEEPCPAGWLIRNMDAGVGASTVQIESLSLGKPLFCYVPVVPDSPLQRKLAESGLMHKSAESLSNALCLWLGHPGSVNIPFDWFRAQFDPFNDDNALDRIIAVLWRNEAAPFSPALSRPS